MNDLKVIFFPEWPDNPYQKLLIENLEQLGVQLVHSDYKGKIFPLSRTIEDKPDILHLHSLYPLFLSPNPIKTLIRGVVALCQLLILKQMGVKIVWTAHDLKHHENSQINIDKVFTTVFARITHAIIAHGETAKQEVAKVFKLKNHQKIFVIPHGNYINYYENKIASVEARERLELSKANFVLLFLGLIRPYKGVPELTDAFKQLHGNGIHLVIAGKVTTIELAEEIKQKTLNHENIHFIPGFVPDDEIQLYMNACDVVALPYRDILTSGSIVLAMSFGRACIAPLRGCIGDMLNASGAFLYDPNNEKGLLQAINSAIQNKDNLLQMGEYNRSIAEHWSWNYVAKMTLDVYTKPSI